MFFPSSHRIWSHCSIKALLGSHQLYWLYFFSDSLFLYLNSQFFHLPSDFLARFLCLSQPVPKLFLFQTVSFWLPFFNHPCIFGTCISCQTQSCASVLYGLNVLLTMKISVLGNNLVAGTSVSMYRYPFCSSFSSFSVTVLKMGSLLRSKVEELFLWHKSTLLFPILT